MKQCWDFGVCPCYVIKIIKIHNVIPFLNKLKSCHLHKEDNGTGQSINHGDNKQPLFFKFWFHHDLYVSVLSLFTILQFPNEPCQTGDGVNGTCYHHLECRSLGGVASGSCAQGYGVCCYCKYILCYSNQLTMQSTFHILMYSVSTWILPY